MPADPSATEDYDIADNCVTLCDSFQYLGTRIPPDLEASSDIDTQVRVATGAFTAIMRDICFDRNIDLRTRKHFNKRAQWGFESWALNTTPIVKFTTFHHKCTRRLGSRDGTAEENISQ
jgi:hypothetical protein